MRIRKWYLDCTADDGTVFIGYAGTLGLGPLTLPVQSCTLHPGTGDPPSTRWRLGPADPLLVSGGGVQWHAPALGVTGTWERRSRPVSRLLLATDQLRVEWRCHLPRGQARIALPGHTVEGWGYVEELLVEGRMDLLPLRELHWGRFLSGQDWLVWLEWRGPHPLTVLLWNGREVPGSVGRDAVTVTDAARLSLAGNPVPPDRHRTGAPSGSEPPEAAPMNCDPIRVLADRRVGNAFFPALPPLRWLLPRGLARLRERKLAGPGRLERDAGDPGAGGRLLFETVEFP